MLIPRILGKALARFVDTDSSRYALNGIQFERDAEGRPHAVATDGRKLLHATWQEPEAGYCPKLASLADATRHPSAEFKLTPSTLTTIDKAAPISASVGARFPQFGYILAAELNQHERYRELADACQAARNAAQAAVTAAETALEAGSPDAAVLADAAEAAKLRAREAEQALANASHVQLAVANPDSGSSTTVDAVDGRFPKWRDCLPQNRHGFEVHRIKLDPRFLADACNSLALLATSEESRGIELAFTAPDRPALLSAELNGTSAECVIMPLAVDEKPSTSADLARAGREAAMGELVTALRDVDPFDADSAAEHAQKLREDFDALLQRITVDVGQARAVVADALERSCQQGECATACWQRLSAVRDALADRLARVSADVLNNGQLSASSAIEILRDILADADVEALAIREARQNIGRQEERAADYATASRLAQLGLIAIREERDAVDRVERAAWHVRDMIASALRPVLSDLKPRAQAEVEAFAKAAADAEAAAYADAA